MKHNHKPGERCYICENGIEKAREMDAENIKKFGWYAHQVYVEDDVLDYHTHGFPESKGVPDMQILLRGLSPKTAHSLMWELVKMMEEGLKPEAGKTIDIPRWKSTAVPGWTCLKVKFVQATQGERTVLRVIFPDRRGDLSRNMDHPFYHQYEGVLDSQLN